MESILTSVKKLLGLTEEDTSFDLDVITHINSAFFVLTQLGVGPKEGFSISDGSSVWNDFIKGDTLEAVKTYVYQKVRIVFDPPSSSALLEVMQNSIKELESRLNIAVDPE